MSAQHKYSILTEIDARGVSNAIKAVEDSISETVQQLTGGGEQLRLRTKIPWTLSTNRPLVDADIEKITKLIEAEGKDLHLKVVGFTEQKGGDKDESNSQT